MQECFSSNAKTRRGRTNSNDFVEDDERDIKTRAFSAQKSAINDDIRASLSGIADY
jgi:hypothetical protein